MNYHDNDLFSHHLDLLRSLHTFCRSQFPFKQYLTSSYQSGDDDQTNDAVTDRGDLAVEDADTREQDLQLLAKLAELCDASQRSEQFTQRGQTVLTRIVGHYHHLTPAINRDLLWFFGGDCLHFMSDEEIERYQRLDELFYQQQQAGTPIDFTTAKATIFQLH